MDENKISLSPLEAQVVAMHSGMTGESVLSIYDQLLFLKTEIRRLQDSCEQRMIEWISANGDIDAGNGVRYYAGLEKTTKCVNVAKAAESILEACGGDWAGFCETLSSNAIKYGAARKVLAPEIFNACFTVETNQELKEGKSTKKLMRADTKYIK